MAQARGMHRLPVHDRGKRWVWQQMLTATTQIQQPQCVYYVERVTPKRKPVYRFAKRAFDLIGAIALLIILAVPMAILAVLIRLVSPGPALFRQERLGKDGVPFTIYKFRTMCLDAEQDGPQWAREHDSRCTKLGKALRKSRMDELPQLINIVRGEMSFVGPRPERAYFYAKFEEYVHGFRQRLQVVPGVTGWAQVNGGYLLRPEEKILYDMEYIEHQSAAFDAKCLFRTIGVVFRHEGAR